MKDKERMREIIVKQDNNNRDDAISAITSDFNLQCRGVESMWRVSFFDLFLKFQKKNDLTPQEDILRIRTFFEQFFFKSIFFLGF
jgi:hypothetical protein